MEPTIQIQADDVAAVHQLEAQAASVLFGKPEVIRLAVVCLLAQGHVLIEDVPGVGKTTLARALARSLGLAFQRIQFTSDLLPSDILGVSVYRRETERFDFLAGPIFASVVLADEINRATPKTQSALLEAMSERQVTVEGERRVLPRPFLVLATQNPLEYVGTFPLPESQLDRFLMSLQIGYPARRDERALLTGGGVDERLESLGPVLDREQIVSLQGRVAEIRVAPQLTDYLLAVATATRDAPEFVLGVSTRGLQGLYRASQALALCEGREFVIPDDVQRLVPPVLAHRVVLRRQGGGLDASRQALAAIVETIAVPL